MITTDALRDYGANVDEGLARCFNNEAFYLKLVGMGLNDANFGKLQMACDAQDARGVFAAAHALKGSIGNLSLTPIYAPLCELTERLRGQTAIGDDARGLLAEVFAQLKRARDLM